MQKLESNEGNSNPSFPSHPNLFWGSPEGLKQHRGGHWRTIKELIGYYKHQDASFPLVTCKIYAYQVFRALSFLRLKNLSAGAMSSKSILVSMDSQQVVICCQKQAGEKYYTPPETLESHQPKSHSADIWAAACIISEMFSVNPIFLSVFAKSQRFPTEKEFNPDDYLPETFPEDLKKLLESCLQYKPENRISATNAMFSPAFSIIFSGTVKINSKEVTCLTDFNALERACYEDHIEKLTSKKTKSINN